MAMAVSAFLSRMLSSNSKPRKREAVRRKALYENNFGSPWTCSGSAMF
jgi:hypothetical protein